MSRPRAARRSASPPHADHRGRDEQQHERAERNGTARGFLANLPRRYDMLGGQASTGSPMRKRWTSRATRWPSRTAVLAFFSGISSPPSRDRRVEAAISFFGSICRSAADDANDSSVDMRVLGFAGSSSWRGRSAAGSSTAARNRSRTSFGSSGMAWFQEAQD